MKECKMSANNPIINDNKNNLNVDENGICKNKKGGFKTNELPGKEVEVKTKLPSDTDMSNLSNAIFCIFKNDKYSPYVLDKKRPDVLEGWISYIQYSTKLNQKKDKKLYKVCFKTRYEKDVVFLKRKSLNDCINEADIHNEYEIVLPYTSWSKEIEDEIKKEQGSFFNISPENIFHTKKMNKQKYKIRIENTVTHRFYTIGLTTKTEEGKGNMQIKNIVIEYVGLEKIYYFPEKINEKYVQKAILNELNDLKKIVAPLLKKFLNGDVLVLRFPKESVDNFPRKFKDDSRIGGKFATAA